MFLKSIKIGENEVILLLSPEHVEIEKYSGVIQTLLPSVRWNGITKSTEVATGDVL